MESRTMREFGGIYAGQPVLVTGHTGFKGSWLSIWLEQLGAKVIGYSLPELPTKPSNFEVSGLAGRVEDVRGDVRDFERLHEVVLRTQPAIIFHLAAQPLVLPAYEAPRETIDVNVGGTVNVLEAARTARSVRAAVCITTDKVYRNREWVWGYREEDRLGGHDPYSASKAMAELAIAAYRQSFFEEGPAVASARAGNVIGGGDFGAHRLVPDCMRALMTGEPVQLRHPDYVRPWQHVLESLSGYLWLGAHLLQAGSDYAEAWNFAPREAGMVTTQMVVERAIALWGDGRWKRTPEENAPKETTLLRLSWEKAASRLGWRSVYSWEEALAATVSWFKAYGTGPPDGMYAICVDQIRAYTQAARSQELPWVS